MADHPEIQVSELANTVLIRAEYLDCIGNNLSAVGNHRLAEQLWEQATILKDIASELQRLSFQLVDNKVTSAYQATDNLFKAVFAALGQPEMKKA